VSTDRHFIQVGVNLNDLPNLFMSRKAAR